MQAQKHLDSKDSICCSAGNIGLYKSLTQLCLYEASKVGFSRALFIYRESTSTSTGAIDQRSIELYNISCKFLKHDSRVSHHEGCRSTRNDQECRMRYRIDNSIRVKLVTSSPKFRKGTLSCRVLFE
jgi:hypothetical protein